MTKIYYNQKYLFSKNFLFKKMNTRLANFNYLSWLQGNYPFIINSSQNLSIDALRFYILKKINSPNTIFFSIHNKMNKHIGNIKFEPILTNKYTIMGVLIGDKDYRGKGFIKEIFDHTFSYLYKNYNLKNIFLGVDKKNLIAIKAFKKYGFKFKSHNKKSVIMSLDLKLKFNS